MALKDNPAVVKLVAAAEQRGRKVISRLVAAAHAEHVKLAREEGDKTGVARIKAVAAAIKDRVAAL